MSIIQLAKVLQLSGFLLASVFGGILLDKAVGGKIAEGFTSLIVGFVDRLRKPMQKLPKEIITAEEPVKSIWPMLPLCFLWMVALTILMIGWLEHISVLLWVGVGLYSWYAMYFLANVAVIIFVPRIRKASRTQPPGMRNGQELSVKEFILNYVVLTIVAVSGIAWLPMLALLFLSYFLKVSSPTMKMLANPRVPKVAFTVLGLAMLLAGLIIDTIAAFST